jgi:hypothetical protein
MADFHLEGAKVLIARGLLVPDGHEAADYSREGDNDPVALDWSEEFQALGHFDPLTGWTTAENDRLTRYRVSPDALASTILLGLEVEPSSSLVVSDEIWDFGRLTIPHGVGPVSLLFIRLVHDPLAWGRIKQWLRSDRSGLRRTLLCPASSNRLPNDAPSGTVLISLRDVLRCSGFLPLDPNAIASRLAAGPASEDPLVVIGDGREVRLHGRTFRFPKGVHQRQIICVLHERYLAGEREVPTAWLVEELELKCDRIRDYFRKCNPPVLDELLWEKGGLCGFCVDQ